MRTLFQRSYQIEALILEADNFPPLKRTLEQYINTDTEFYGFWQEQTLAAVIELRFSRQSIHVQSLVVDPDFFRHGIATKLMNHVLTNFESILYTVETQCLIKKGYLIKGSTTNQQKLAQLEQAHILAFLIKLQNLTHNTEEFLNSNILIIAIAYKDINNFRQLITLIEKSSIKKVVFISSTSVYPSHNSEVDEETETLDTALAQIENLIRCNENFKSTIIRFAGLFGYDRKPGNFIKKSKSVKDPEGFINLIHRDDCIAIIEQIIARNIWGETFNACADDHPSRRNYYTQESNKQGLAIPTFNENVDSDFKIVSNKKLKNHLGYKFKFSKL